MSRPGLPNRRHVLSGLALAGAGLACPALAQSRPLVQVVKDPNCGCCSAWIEIMADAGFDMEVRNASFDALQRFKAASGIAPDMASCHTAAVDGYIIEGHVPPADIRRLLAEQPEAIGLSVPGMPYGSPGMGPEDQREAYSVFLIGKDGRTEVFAHYAATA
ncbi:DUF411 domain-containing protein [Ovoidimarina sediminis]|uniref:DUF411 domain-containing protein n=1 Tax=Ovoidimarina sediminis TaxID=3079856 RepID=UPI00290749B8|nr:DUF411 domain-containing protein [Rhodophyticola sp. MJ-SS7]MDU8943386.1 DUF411 domain-containing protein [Rhodophyticola sp. MJ-SS7]